MATQNSLDLTQIIGACSRFQVTIVITVNSAYVMSAWGMMFMAFGLYNPGWTCLDADNTFNRTLGTNETISYHHASLNQTLVSNSENVTTISWIKDCSVKKRCQNLMYNPETSTIVTEWSLSCGQAWVPSIIISILMVGSFFGAYLAGQVGDRLGRKLSFYSSVGLYAVSQLAAAFASSWEIYAVFMFFIGFGAGGIFASYFHYPLEFLSTWWRGILASIPFWNLGCALFALIVYLWKDWRYVHITGAITTTIVFLTVFWTPESVRWLAVRGKVKEAKKIVARIAKINRMPCPERQVIDDIAAKEKTQMGGHVYTYLDLCRFKSIRGYSIKFAFIWIGVMVSFYVMNFGIKSLSGNFYLNLFIFSVLDFPGVVLVAPMINSMGRRGSGLVYFGLASIACLLVVCVFFVASGSTRDVIIMVCTLICKSAILGSFYVIRVFSSELYPTVVRSLHYGYLNGMSRIGAILSPYILSNDPSTLYVPFLVVGLINLVVCAIIYTLPETKGRALQDTANEGHLSAIEADPVTENV